MSFDYKQFEKTSREIFAPAYPAIAEEIFKYLKINNGICLDIGAGVGYLGISMAKITDLKVCLFDISKEILKYADKNIKEEKLDNRMKILCGDVHEISLQDNSVDLVISRGSIFFWDDLGKAFKEIYRILKKGGATYIGGGFGSAKIKKEVKFKMQKIDKNWHKNTKCNKAKEFIEKVEKGLKIANISTYQIIDDETGLWLIIRKN